MTLDTHLYHLVAQFIQADGNQTEQHRLQDCAKTHLKKRAPNRSDIQVLHTWATLIDALSIES